MRHVLMICLAGVSLAACSTAPRPLVPDSPEGPASYVCYSSLTASADDVLAVAQGQCGRWGLGVKGLIGQTLSPGRCGTLTPMVAGYRCGGSAFGGFSARY